MGKTEIPDYPHQGHWWRRAGLKLLDIGYPAAVEQGVFQLGFFVFLMLIGRVFGTEAFAAYNIGVNILSLCMTVGFGFRSPDRLLSVGTWVPRTQQVQREVMAVYDIRCNNDGIHGINDNLLPLSYPLLHRR